MDQRLEKKSWNAQETEREGRSKSTLTGYKLELERFIPHRKKLMGKILVITKEKN
jgi:hypothetical protein